jgi:glutamate--cysteine ligase
MTMKGSKRKMTAREPAALHKEDLRSLFEKSDGAAERIGIEIENAVVDPATGRAVPYHGSNGVGSLVLAIVEEFGGEPIFDGDHVTGMRHDSGIQITLEHGGALEYSSAPHDDVVSVIADTRAVLTRAAELARRLGLAILPGANMPFNTVADVPIVDKPRGAIMREFFARIGDAGACATTVMGTTLSTQVTLDYLSEDDLVEKLRTQVAASPVIAGLFVNSPLEGGKLTGLLSRRTQCWLKTDPRRCGVLAPALKEEMRIDHFVEWAMALPMIYHLAQDGTYRHAPDRPFGALLTEGFADGTKPTMNDWISHLSQIWTDVRLRQTLELRVADGPAYPDIPAVPALWVGLTYHPASRAAAWELLRHYTVDEHRAAMPEVAAQGLAARLGGDSLHDLARELVRLADAGLSARIRAGLEQPEVLSYLDPIKEVISTGVTFAQRCIQRWERDLQRSPQRYVDAYRLMGR